MHYLREMLPPLLAQAEVLGLDVCVSDNWSQDGTGTYLNELSSRHSHLRVHLQPQSLSLDESMFAAIGMATSEYVYPIGDDDFLMDNALSVIVEELKSNPDILILNAIHTGSLLEPKKEHLPQRLKDKVFSVPDQAFEELWDKMHFGSFVFRRAMFNAASLEKYLGTNHAYSGCVWDSLLHKYEEYGDCLVKSISTPVVFLRGGEKSWGAHRASIVLYDIPFWFLSLPNYYQINVPRCLENWLSGSFKFMNLIHYRGSGQLTGELIEKIQALRIEMSINRKMSLFLVSRLPLSLSRLIYNIYESIGINRKKLKALITNAIK